MRNKNSGRGVSAKSSSPSSVATESFFPAAPRRRVAMPCAAPRPPLLLCHPREDKEATEAALSLSPPIFPSAFPPPWPNPRVARRRIAGVGDHLELSPDHHEHRRLAFYLHAEEIVPGSSGLTATTSSSSSPAAAPRTRSPPFSTSSLPSEQSHASRVSSRS